MGCFYNKSKIRQIDFGVQWILKDKIHPKQFWKDAIRDYWERRANHSPSVLTFPALATLSLPPRDFQNDFQSCSRALQTSLSPPPLSPRNLTRRRRVAQNAIGKCNNVEPTFSGSVDLKYCNATCENYVCVQV